MTESEIIKAWKDNEFTVAALAAETGLSEQQVRKALNELALELKV